jgi:hypothetical protein
MSEWRKLRAGIQIAAKAIERSLPILSRTDFQITVAALPDLSAKERADILIGAFNGTSDARGKARRRFARRQAIEDERNARGAPVSAIVESNASSRQHAEKVTRQFEAAIAKYPGRAAIYEDLHSAPIKRPDPTPGIVGDALEQIRKIAVERCAMLMGDPNADAKVFRSLPSVESVVLALAEERAKGVSAANSARASRPRQNRGNPVKTATVRAMRDFRGGDGTLDDFMEAVKAGSIGRELRFTVKAGKGLTGDARRFHIKYDDPQGERHDAKVTWGSVRGWWAEAGR